MIAAPAIPPLSTARPGTVPARYSSLDAWRGVACLLVIAYHSSIVYSSLATSPAGRLESAADALIRTAEHGRLGVPFFFVISGYCIAAAAEGVRTGRRSTASFFVRRFRRIYPPFWIVVAASVVFFAAVDVVLAPTVLSSTPWMQPRPWWYDGWQWAGNLTLTETWREHIVGSPRAHFPGQAWTLCYEEQFYAVTGVLLAVSRRRFFAGIGAVTIATMAAVAWFSRDAAALSGFFFDGRWLTFAAGVLVYWVLTYAPGTRMKATATLVLLVAAGSTRWLPVPDGSEAFIFAALLLWLHGWDAALVASRWVAPLTYCGQMCYSLYLVHQLIVKAVTAVAWNLGLHSAAETLLIVFPASFAASIVAGRLCFLLVERHYLNPSGGVERVRTI